MNPSKDQLTGMLERAVTVFFTWFLTYASTKGYLTTSQVAEFLPLLIGIGTVIVGWWVNRAKNLVQAAAAIPGTVVVTTPELAKATPDQNNIVSNADTKVVSKVAGQ